ncbi:MAG: sulfatase [Pseudomonadales bacterium]
MPAIRIPRPLIAACVLLTLLAGPGTAFGTGQPNILVLMAEDMSDHVGAFGDPLARTPHLDALAATGVRFPNTFTTAGVCAPSRAAFITGVHQISLGAQHMRTSTSPVATYLAVPPPEVKAFPELLRRAGYYTFTDRKLDYQFSGIGAGTGPESIWDSEGELDPLSTLPDDRPFFGLINFFITHESATFTPEAVAGTPGETMARRASAARSKIPDRTDPNAVSVPPYYPDTKAVRAHIAVVYDNIRLMDAEVGRILKRLDELGRAEDTIVIWTTDHGDPLPRAKRELFDSGIRVPLIIRWPQSLQPAGLEPGSLDERLVSFVDLAPIILGMAGAPAPDFLQGADLLAEAVPPRRYVYASRDRMDEQTDRVRAVRDARYKYLRYFDPGTPGAVHLAYRDQGRIMQALWRGHDAGTLSAEQRLWFEPRPEEALYDLASDPYELVNLAADPTRLETLTRMRSAYAAWRIRVPDLGEVAESELAARFWPEGVQPVTPVPVFSRLADGRLEVTAADNASIEVRMGDGAWRLYTTPLEPGNEPVTARAVRYGYALSAEVSLPEVSPPEASAPEVPEQAPEAAEAVRPEPAAEEALPAATEPESSTEL